MRVRGLCLLAAFVILAGSGVAAHASCPTLQQGPPCMEFWRAEAVFIGVATRVEHVPNNTQLMVGPYLRTTAYFNVEEAFRGVDRSAIVFEMDHCGYLFKEGERYLVYANRNPNNQKLEVRAGNSRTRLLAEATEDLQYIRGLATAEPGARIFGKVLIFTNNIRKAEYEGEGIPNTKVTLEGTDQRREIFTNSQGEYEFKNLAVGTYQVHAELPADLGRAAPTTIKVTGRACIRNDFSTMPWRQIGGQVWDVDGKPVAGVPVSLVAADAGLEQIVLEGRDTHAWTFTLTNDQGEYLFSDLKPGRYVVVINRSEFERSRGAEAARALPRIFYPGVNDLTGATVIVIGKEEHHEEKYDFHLTVPE